MALITPIEREACPLNLAPTASTTITMVLGDAIAGALMVAKDFHAEDFARSHPAGALGRRLLLKVSDVMHDLEELPCVSLETDGTEAVGIMAKNTLVVLLSQIDKNRSAFSPKEIFHVPLRARKIFHRRRPPSL